MNEWETWKEKRDIESGRWVLILREDEMQDGRWGFRELSFYFILYFLIK